MTKKRLETQNISSVTKKRLRKLQREADELQKLIGQQQEKTHAQNVKKADTFALD